MSEEKEEELGVIFHVNKNKLMEGLSKLDCFDNSCHFMGRRKKGGMRTNGGCRCLRDVPHRLRNTLINFYREQK